MLKGILLLLGLTTGLLAGETEGYTENISQTIQVSMDEVHFYFDGEADSSGERPGYFSNGVGQIPKAINYEGTTYVPLRYFGEHLGQEVGWDAGSASVWIGGKPQSFSPTAHQTITQLPTSYGNATIQVETVPFTFYFNGVKEENPGDPGYFYNGITTVPKGFSYRWSTYVPLRYLSERMHKEVSWDQATRTISVGNKGSETSAQVPIESDNGIYGLSLGKPSTDVEKLLGAPDRKDSSALGYEWWIYNKDLSHYVQVGIQNGEVVDLYSNAPTWDYKDIKVGTDKESVNQELTLQETVDVSYSGANFTLTNQEFRPLYLIGDNPVIVYLDKYNQSRVTGIRFLNKEILLKSKSYSMNETYYEQAPDLSTPTLSTVEQKQVANGNELQVFDLTNVARLRNNLSVLTWNPVSSDVGRDHSQDMNTHHYFDHVSATSGLDPFQRMEQAGISFHAAGENIAEGYFDAIEAYEGWMNSLGHRENILNEHFTTLGVGVYQLDYSQEFVTP